MQPRPTAAELLAAVAEVLEGDVVPALRGPVQHQARVAASLVGIVERELRLGPAGDERERAALVALVGDGGDLAALRARLATALREGLADDPAAAATVWDTLMAVARADLAVAKPGHDDWDGD